MSQIGDVPRGTSHDTVKAVFSVYGDSKGIWAGKLQSHGIVMLAFFDLRHSQNAKRSLDSRDVHIVMDHVEQVIRMRSNFVSLPQVVKVRICVVVCSAFISR